MKEDEIKSSHPGTHLAYAGTGSYAKKMAFIAETQFFQIFITLTILFAGVLVGLETYKEIVHAHHDLLMMLDKIVLGIFILEIFIKMSGQGYKIWLYFLDPWNIFDFVIVAASLLPIGSEYAMVLRLIRLLRVLKLITALPKLQILVSALLKSIPSMGYVSIFLFILFYIYGVAAVFIFGENDPIHFSSLHLSLLSLFRVVTLEDWTDIMYIAMYGCENYGYGGNENICVNSNASPVVGAVFFSSFVLIGTMVILNLFIGVIMNGMDEAKKEMEEEIDFEKEISGSKVTTLEEELDILRQKIKDVESSIETIARKAGT
ncbi:MAG: ion transporter [Spirochaetia bacterium]|nr:ion transporter [Spirochaetia bacterium]